MEFGIFQDVMESSTLAILFAVLLQLDTKCSVCLLLCSCFAVASCSLISPSQKGINSGYSACYLQLDETQL